MEKSDELKEDVIDRPKLGGIFDYGNTGMTYPDVAYQVMYGFFQGSIGLQTTKQ